MSDSALMKATTSLTFSLCVPPSPVPQALGLTWHAEAIPVVGEVAVNKQDEK